MIPRSLFEEDGGDVCRSAKRNPFRIGGHYAVVTEESTLTSLIARKFDNPMH